MAIERDTTPTVPYLCVSGFQGGDGLGGGAGAPVGAEEWRAVLFELTDKLLPAALGEKEAAVPVRDARVRQSHRRRADQHDVGDCSMTARRAEWDGACRCTSATAPARICFAIHDRRIKLGGAIRCENRATAGVEQRTIFEQLDGASTASSEEPPLSSTRHGLSASLRPAR